MKLLSMADLRAKGIHYSKQHLWRLIRAGKFPKPIKIGERRVAFLLEDVDNFIESKVAERDAELAKTPAAA